MLPSALKNHYNRSSNTNKNKNESLQCQKLVIEIKIKDKPPKNILLSNINDSALINQQIKWFMSTNNLKEQAFDYIKNIITLKISENQQNNKNKHKSSVQSKQNSVNKPVSHSIGHIDFKISQSITPQFYQSKQPHQIQINLSNPSTPQVPQVRVVEDTFAFNSQFTLPSSIGQKQRSQLSEQMFETNPKTCSNFSTVNQILPHDKKQLINASLSIKPFPGNFNFTTPEISEEIEKKSMKKRIPILVNFSSKDKLDTSPTFRSKSGSKKKSLSTKERKYAIMGPKTPKRTSIFKKQQFLLYDAENLQNIVTRQSTQMKEKDKNRHKQQDEQIVADLKCLYDKLTSKNPPSVEGLDSQYVSYQQLTKEELLLMGTLFQSIDHSQLNHLYFDQFKQKALKYCKAQVYQLHLNKKNMMNRMSWTFPVPTLDRV